MGHTRDVAISGDGKHLATSHLDGAVKLWDVSELIAALKKDGEIKEK
jgi:hypothetical protein